MQKLYNAALSRREAVGFVPLVLRSGATVRGTGSAPHSPERSEGESLVVEDASRLDNAADEENPLIVRRKAPHNQRIEQTPFRRSSSALTEIINYD